MTDDLLAWVGLIVALLGAMVIALWAIDYIAGRVIGWRRLNRWAAVYAEARQRGLIDDAGHWKSAP